MCKPKQNYVLTCLCAISCGIALTGCSSTKTEMTPAEQQSFKSTGPMPPEAAKIIARQQEEAQKRMQAQGAPAGAPQSVPGKQ